MAPLPAPNISPPRIPLQKPTEESILIAALDPDVSAYTLRGMCDIFESIHRSGMSSMCGSRIN